MNWQIILFTFIFMILGYLIGSIINSLWITKLLKLEDVRNKGSKNVGATNVKRIHGNKIGFIVFVLDIFKTIFAMGIASLLIGPKNIIIPAIGIAVVIGHIFPIFNNFQGGKGAACMLGFIIIINWTLFFIGAFIFFVILFLTKKVSLCSMISPFLIIIIYIGLSQIDFYRSKIFEPITYIYSYWLNVISLTIIMLLVIFAHRDNIKRLLSKTENTY